ncbi:uncharacterized protein LOC133662738 [Entelurus aequoreus]|uniref:uncharacterized protein LOC133662738 n=1 Tax=Entelurus aequoreus TaxID=161455 RepID=UPI002B1E2EE4|nr:uncharacterized protein LOC133662738 [Entelurus aequoreus]
MADAATTNAVMIVATTNAATNAATTNAVTNAAATNAVTNAAATNAVTNAAATNAAATNAVTNAAATNAATINSATNTNTNATTRTTTIVVPATPAVTRNPTTVLRTTQIGTTALSATVITRRVTFRSLQSTFSSDLLNSSSPAFRARAAMIRIQLQPLFQNAFPSTFKLLTIVAFRSGSVINDMDLQFANTSPNNTEIAQVLTTASSIVAGFDIELASITVDGIVSSGAPLRISVVTAGCLLILSWLLSQQ